MSISDYSLKFRTLAAASGWNESSLQTTYRQGLAPGLRLHLAAYDDSMGLEKFIQLSLQVARHVQHCLDEQPSQYFPHHLRQPEFPSAPEPDTEPMQLGNTRLPFCRQRRLAQSLCLYCGASGHIRYTCPIRPPRPTVSFISTPLLK